MLTTPLPSSASARALDFKWPAEGVARAPYRLFTDPEIYKLEQERIFRGRSWNYLCLDVEIPKAGDYRTTVIGETPIIVTRDHEGEVHAMVNRCAHKGALVCLKKQDNVASLTCVYHAWNYGLDGQLKGVAFRNGIRGQGGMPSDFDVAKHRLQPIRIENFCGIIFGTFSNEVEDVETYLGPTWRSSSREILIARFASSARTARPFTITGSYMPKICATSYHATLLHTFYTTFKVNRLDMDGGIILSDEKWHHLSFARRAKLQEAAEYSEAKVHSANYESALEGPGLLEAWEEFDDGITHSIQTVFPNMCIQFTLNSLAIRFFAPKGVDKTELFWIYLGYDRDTEEQSQMRIMQSNLTGAAGLVSLEDGCINEFVQRGTRNDPECSSFMEMGGRVAESEKNSRATETAVRGFWQGYRGIMGF